MDQNAQDTTPDPGGPAAPAPHASDGFFDSIRRSGLVRTDERWVGGVAGGVALRFGIDPLVVRGLLAVSVLFGGLGLVLYGLGWLLVTDQRDGRIHLQQLFRGDVDVAVVGAVAVVLSGLAFPNRWASGVWWGLDSDWWQAVVWLSLLALVVVLVVAAASRKVQEPPRDPRAGQPGTPVGPVTTLRPGQGQRFTAPAPPYGPASTVPLAPMPARGVTAGAPATPDSPAPPTSPAPSMEGTSMIDPQLRPTAPTASSPQPSWPGGPAGPTSAGWAPAGRPGPATALPRPVRQGAGSGTVGVVVGLVLMTLATLLALQRTGDFDGPVALTTVAVSIVLLGLAIIVSGLRGRTTGGLSVLAVVAVLTALPLTAVHTDGWGTTVSVGDVDSTPTDVATAERGYTLGLGEVRIDLTELPLDGETVQVPIRLGAGELTVVMPRDGAYVADIGLGAGEVRWLDEIITSSAGRESWFLESPGLQDGATPDIELDVSVGAGTVTVVEEGR